MRWFFFLTLWLTSPLLPMAIPQRAIAQAPPPNQVSGTLPTQAIAPKVAQGLLNVDLRFAELRPNLNAFLKTLGGAVPPGEGVDVTLLTNTSTQLQGFQQQLQDLSVILKTTTNPPGPEILAILADLDRLINEMRQMVDPLQKGLNPVAVEQVQKQLNFFDRRNIDPQYYGLYGPTTQEELEIYLNRRLEASETQMIALNEAITGQRFGGKWSEIQTPLLNHLRIFADPSFQSLYSQMEDLAQRHHRLKREVRFILYLSSLVLFLGGGGGCALLWLRHKQQRSQASPKIAGSRPYGLTENDIQEIEGEVYRRLVKRFPKALPPHRQMLEDIPLNADPLDLSRLSEEEPISPVVTVSEEVLPLPQEAIPAIPEWDFEPLDSSTPEEDIEGDLPKFENPYDGMVRAYQDDPQGLAVVVVAWNERESAIPEAILQPREDGPFWIAAFEGVHYLLPQPQWRVTPDNYPLLKRFFVCYGYRSGQDYRIKLLKPGRVSALEGGDRWEFVQQGIVEFEPWRETPTSSDLHTPPSEST